MLEQLLSLEHVDAFAGAVLRQHYHEALKQRDHEATWHEAAVAFSNHWELAAGSGCRFVDGTSCASRLLVDRLRAECNSSGTRLPITRLMDDPSFPSIADAYASNVPFPHAAFDGFDVVGDDAALDGLAGEFPRVGEKAVGWSSRLFDGVGDMDNKRYASSENLMGPKAREALRFMKSSNFVTFLERLTNITGLLIDPHNVGAGLHQSLHGGFLEAHTDFNLLEAQNVYRRVNVFLYLNRDWRPEFGGQLELLSSSHRGGQAEDDGPSWDDGLAPEACTVPWSRLDSRQQLAAGAELRLATCEGATPAQRPKTPRTGKQKGRRKVF